MLNALLLLLMGSANSATATASCAALAGLRLPDVKVLSAVAVTDREGLPPFCSVLGYVRPAIHFEVRLPLSGWNRGFYMAGCGGFCGQLGTDNPGFINAATPGLVRGYAVATTDGGHWGETAADARWAYHNRVAEVDFGHRAVRGTAKAAQAIIEVYFGAAAETSIFQGCSNGGRQAHMLALHDPELFDGIISGAPALDYTGLVATWMAAMVQANTDEHDNQIITPAVVPLIAETVYAQCDTADGLKDELISAPQDCEIDWSDARCTEGREAPCLTDRQLATLKVWYETGAIDSAGRQLYRGTVPYGSEPFWWLWLVGDGAGGGRMVPTFNRNFLQFMAFPEDPGEGYGTMDFDLDHDPPRLNLMASIYDADDPDLAAFRDAGGRMITWHGLADAIVPPGGTVDHYREVIDAAGGLVAAQEFNRLFLIPGMDHCGLLQGPGPDQRGFDLLSVMESWLSGEAPDSILLRRMDEVGNISWERPVCAWPQVAHHAGAGDWRKAGSFSCR